MKCKCTKIIPAGRIGLGYKTGKGDPIIKEKIVEVQVMDKGFCMSCYKKHKWDEMYVIASEYEGFIYN